METLVELELNGKCALIPFEGAGINFICFFFVLSVEKVHKRLFYEWRGSGGSAL